MKHWIITIALLFKIITISGCYHQEESNFKVEVKALDKFQQESTTFTKGEEIVFDLTITNISSKFQKLWYGGSSIFELIVRDSNNGVAWILPFERPSNLSVVEIDLSPNESFTTGYIWNQKGNDGIAIEAGDYEVEGKFLSVSESGKLSISIQ